MQHLFNDLIKQHVKPFLTERGFAKKSLSFYKATEDLVYMFNFQKSRGNSADNVMFYVNCGIYAAELAQIQGKGMLSEPQEADCHFRARLEEIASSVPSRFSITPDTNLEEMGAVLLDGLDTAIRFYEKMTSARAIVDYYAAGSFLHMSEEGFHLLLGAGDIPAAQRYVKGLQEKHGSETRWAIFEKKYSAIFSAYGVQWEG